MYLVIAVCTCWYLFDQVIKWSVADAAAHGRVPMTVTPHFNIVYLENRGVSFGFLSSFNLPPWTLALFSVVTVLVFILWFGKLRSQLIYAALGLIAGGAMSNATDRLARGAVVDFLDLHAGDWHWPAFNVADVGIVSGAALAAIYLVFIEPRKHAVSLRDE